MTARNGLLYIAFIFSGFVLASCGDDHEVAARQDAAAYFPLEDSVSRVYEVEDITISPLGGSDTLRYQLLETVGDYFINSSGVENYNLYRYRRTDSGDEWVFQSTTPLRIQEGNYIVTENNIPYVKLASPLFDGKEWDGNAYNAFAPDVYTSQLSDSDSEWGELLIVVQEELLDTIVAMDIRKEVYSKDIGLVHREITLLNYCTRPECLGQGIVEDGRIYQQTLENIW